MLYDSTKKKTLLTCFASCDCTNMEMNGKSFSKHKFA